MSVEVQFRLIDDKSELPFLTQLHKAGDFLKSLIFGT
jgi:hypothetical protein